MSTSIVETRKFTSSSSRGEGFGTDRDHELGAMLKEREREIEREHAGTVDARYTRSEERSESSREYGRGGGEASDGMRRHDRDYGRDNLGTYRPMMTSRNLVIQRSTYGGHPSWSYGGGDRVSRTTERRFGSSYSGLPAGSYANVTNSEVNTMRVSREKEKRDMQDLNERFASYIEKVRFLEAQNKKLSDELDKLKSSWGKETSAVKTMFQTELTEARRLMDDNERDKAKLELRNASLEDQVADLKARLDESNRIALQDKEKVERQNQQLSDYEAEINLLRRRVEGLENDRDRDRKQINHLTDNLNRARMDLDHETLQHIDSENRRQTLEDEIEFLRAVHDQEMKELAALVYRDTTTENREFWKNEMGQALREIQQVYDDKLDGMRGEMESFYNMKIQEFRTEVAKRPSVDPVYTKEVTSRMKTQMTELYDKISDLDGKNQHLIRELDNVRRTRDEREREWETENTDLKMEVSKLRAELDSILQELQSIMHTKLGLELEIAAYRKLLESEESRLTTIRTTDTTVIDSRGGGTQVDIDRERSRGQVDIDRDRGRVPIDERDRSREDRNRGRVHIDERERSREDREKGRVQIDERDRSREDRDRGRIHIDERERDRERERERERERMKDRDYGRGGGYRESSGGRSYEREGGSRDRDMSSGGRDRDFSGGRDRDFGGGREKDLSGGRDRDSDYIGGGRSSSGGRSGGRGTMEPHITPRSDRRSYATPGADADDDREAEGFVEDAAGNDQAKDDLGFLLKGEGTAKTSLQRSAKGPVSIGECDQEGRFVEFENTGRKDEMLSGWMLRRSIDGADQPAFIFPDNYVLRPGSKIKIWSSDFKPISLPYGDLVSQVGKWGQGVNVITKLINPHGEERAIHTQRITYM